MTYRNGMTRSISTSTILRRCCGGLIDKSLCRQLKKVLESDYTKFGNPLDEEDASTSKVKTKKRGSKRARNDNGTPTEGVPPVGFGFGDANTTN